MMITGILSDNHARTLLTSHARYAHHMPAAAVRPMPKGKAPRLVKRLAMNDTNLRLVFGMDRETMFRQLAKNLGYQLEG